MRSVKGNFIIETILVLFVFVTMQLLLIEAIRRSVFRIVLGHLTCEEVRMKSLGAEASSIQSRSAGFLRAAFNEALAKTWIKQSIPKHFKMFEYRILRQLNLHERGGGVTERYLRYPQLLRFEMKNQKVKHHQEIRVRCSFPFSS